MIPPPPAPAPPALPPLALLDHLDPRARIAAALTFCVLVAGLKTPAGLAAALAAAVLLACAARLPLRPTLRKLAALEGFLLLALLSLPFTAAGEPAFHLWGLTATAEGLTLAATILVRAAAAVLATAALAGALEPATLGRALSRLGAPDKLVHLYLFTVRYLDVLQREYVRLRHAMTARGFRPGCNRHTWRACGQLFGMLTVRSLERADRVVAAMRCRGFDGRLRPLREDEDARFRLPDGVFAALTVTATALAAALPAAAGGW